MGGDFINYVEGAKVGPKVLENIVENREYNENIIWCYEKAAEDPIGFKLSRKQLEVRADRLEGCNKVFQLDVYENQKLKLLKRTNLCKDKFCENCKQVRQRVYLIKYIRKLEEHKDNLYHLTLTIPNVPGADLEDTLKKMRKNLKMLTRYLSGNKKIRNVDFENFGYKGALSSLEVTYNSKTFHPHYHLALVLENFSLGEKIHENAYSYNNKKVDGKLVRELKRKFSSEEILIQKVWYLLWNNITVNEKNIEETQLGYTCSIDKFEDGHYQELFKYLVKGTKENGDPMGFIQFKYLLNALYGMPQLLAYGCLRGIQDTDEWELYSNEWEILQEELKKIEYPQRICQTPEDILSDKSYSLLSKAALIIYLMKNNTINQY